MAGLDSVSNFAFIRPQQLHLSNQILTFGQLFLVLDPLIHNFNFVQRLRRKPWTYKSKFCFSSIFFLIFRIQFSGDAARRHQALYDVATLLLMALDPWRNSTPIFWQLSVRQMLRILGTYSLQKRSLRWTSLKRKIMELIKVDQHEDKIIKRLSLAMPH